MSTHDGTCNEDIYCPQPATVGVEVAPQLLAQHMNVTAPPPPPHTLLMGSTYMQPQAQPLQPSQQQQPPQQLAQHYNEYFYNLYATQPGQPETYSVLPVGHGNFLKVYHCQENTAGTGITNDGTALYHAQAQSQAPPQQYQQQPQPAFHMRQPQPQAQAPQYFNSYELFSSNTIMPTPDSQTTLGRSEIKTTTMTLTQQAPIYVMNNQEEPIIPQNASTSTTNMIINKLVNNWSPKVTGAPIQQFPLQSPTVLINPESTNNAMEPEIFNSGVVQVLTNDLEDQSNLISAAPTPTQPMPVLPVTQVPPIESLSTENQNNSKDAVSNNAISSSNAALSPTVSASQINVAPEVKKRIVAEVKPMRMSYSDVLSKVNGQQSATGLLQNNNKQTNGKNGKTPAPERKAENGKSSADNGIGLPRRQISIGEEGNVRSSKKSPTHENKENLLQIQNGSAVKNTKRLNNGNNTVASPANDLTTNNNTQNKNGQKGNQKSIVTEANVANGSKSNSNGISKKRSSNNNNNKRSELDTNKMEQNGQKSTKSNSGNSEKDFNGYYNITAKNNEGGERASKTTNNGYVPSSSNVNTSTANTRKYNKSASSFNNSSNSSSFSTNQPRTRYSNSNSNSSYSYSSKRSRNTNSSYGNTSAGSSNRNYELAKKFLSTWLEYTIKILTWLFYLIYDIVVLGCSVAYDRLVHACECGIVYAQQLRKDFKQNSNKPSIWLKNYWRRFDARFKKNSPWAFWRRFYQKKPPEPSTESMKSGRLPQTGEEAMYSLLNCKGKDAYSILGVPPDCSQEQIRKHYKKIAVLVHPDKNKQAGAEEAFKVLQRAFELIGEPEKRLAYDQSLAEALNAEKAWTELHDLLSQLQTKITEAANTIRCSTCGLRHPRRLTDRPHYAARECASCKIRHSAREGDIWAETSMMGLRWRYLALMEGKVYDITEWANCQKGALSHLEPNSHMVQYRIVRGAQQQQQHQQQQQQPQSTHSPHHQNPQQPYSQQPGSHHERGGSGKFKRNVPPSEASLHEFLDNLYSGQHPNAANSSTAYSNPSRRRTRRN
ncbi:putative uncharacterized protein DDB_G0281251 [Ceratitis capitata]|nr:putative uncharacterized protein DDB_G0281251 [Ceratitis capitata]